MPLAPGLTGEFEQLVVPNLEKFLSRAMSKRGG
jgi:hypothetical protein